MNVLQFIATCFGGILAAWVSIKVARISHEVEAVKKLNTNQHQSATTERVSSEATLLNKLDAMHEDQRDLAHRVGMVDAKITQVHNELKDHIAVDLSVQTELLGRLPQST